MEEGSIDLEELGQQTFDPMPVDIGDWVKKLKIDVDEFLGEKNKSLETAVSQSLPSRRPLLAFFSASFTYSSFRRRHRHLQPT